MKGFKTLAAGLLASLFMVSGVQAETPKNLSELLKNVKSESIVESKENKARELSSRTTEISKRHYCNRLVKS